MKLVRIVIPGLQSLVVAFGCMGRATAQNLVSNGDFESGNSGFSSQYVYSPGTGFPAGVYDVRSSPSAWNSNFSNCSDHSLPPGSLMMTVSGSASVGQRVWTQTFPVLPTTTYQVSFWATSLSGVSPATLRAYVNGIQVGSQFNLSTSTCSWLSFSVTWMSGANDQATLQIVDTNLATSGNDFALDDIAFLSPPQPISFCFGDGTGGLCPCSNFGTAGRGCQNSAGTGGAFLVASGTTIPDAVTLTASGELATALTIFLQGDAASAPQAFGDGVRCMAGTLKRLFTKSAIGGLVAAPGAGDLSITAQSALLGDPIAAGSARYYVTYYRDADAAFCPAPQGGTFSASQCVSLVW